MLALDLVQAGYDAHAASDEQAAIEQVRDLAASGRSGTALILDFDSVDRASILSRRVISVGVQCRVVVAVDDHQRRQAEDEATLLDWLGVIPKPIEVEAVAALLGEADDRQPVRVVREVDSGSLRDDELGDLLGRIMEDPSRAMEQINAVVQLKSKGRGGKVAILQGQLVHAQTDEDQGRHALERMFCWRKGMWRIVRGVHAGPKSLRGSARAHVAAAREYARRVNQARQSVPHQDAVCGVRWERVRPLPAVAESLFRRIAAGAPLGEALEGDGDDELEAYAALLARIKRNAVFTQDGARGPISGTRESTRVANLSGAIDAPMVNAAEPAPRGDRHPATSAYHTVGDLMSGVARTPVDLPADLPEPDISVRENTPLRPILPLDLPEYRGDSAPDVTAETSPPEPVVERRSVAGSGWFGANMAHQESVPTTDLSSVQKALVEAVPVAQAEPDERRSMSVSRVPRPERPPPAAVESAYTLWSHDYQGLESEVEQEVSNYEELKGMRPRSRGSTAFWILALGLVGAVLALIILPSDWQTPGASHHAATAEQEAPVLRTYRQAVGFIDQDRRSEALVLLRNVAGKPGIAPEALLQLAVLEIDSGMVEHGRGHLELYLDDPKAAERERAAALYKHVFGPRSARPRTP